MSLTTDVFSTTQSSLEAVHTLSQDLRLSLEPEERYLRFATTVQETLRADAVTLLRLTEQTLAPVAACGLATEVLGQKFSIADHPRFRVICESRSAVLFPRNSKLPDPFDCLLGGVEGFTHHVHACLGIPIRVGGTLEGVLALDAVDPDAFSSVPSEYFDLLATIGSAVLQLADQHEAVELATSHRVAITASSSSPVAQRYPGRMAGNSTALCNLKEEIALFAGSEFPVLITGKTGTGKELVVQQLHAGSSRSHQPLIYVNCAALPESVVESELFGHELGAFTGAAKRRAGKFQVADGGCLFLDEIGELPLSVQPKLLRVLQAGEIQRVGSDTTHRVSVRVFAATNRDLEQEVEAGRFRSDLLHRLDVCRIVVPSLVARGGDVPYLAGQFCDQARRSLGLGPIRIHPDGLAALNRYTWPGNVRELENVISRSVLRASRRVPRGNLTLILPKDLGAEFCEDDEALPVRPAPTTREAGLHEPRIPTPIRPLRKSVEDYQRELIRSALAQNKGVWAAAARDLGMHRSNLRHLSVRLGMS